MVPTSSGGDAFEVGTTRERDVVRTVRALGQRLRRQRERGPRLRVELRDGVERTHERARVFVGAEGEEHRQRRRVGAHGLRRTPRTRPIERTARAIEPPLCDEHVGAGALDSAERTG